MKNKLYQQFIKFMESVGLVEKADNKPSSMQIQSLIFDKSKFSKEQAQAWAKEHHYATEVDETGSSYRLRQLDPAKFKTMRTISLKPGLSAVVAKRIEKVSPTSSQVHVPATGEQERITIKSKSGHTIEISQKSHDEENLEELRDSFSRFIDEEELEKDALTTEGRKHVAESNFAIPGERKYPIHDLSHARNALARVAQHGSEDEKSKVKAAVYRKYPSLRPVQKADASRRISKIAVLYGSKLLMGKRRDNNKWTMPGGHVDANETMKEGALRELEEETGIQADPRFLFPLTPLVELQDRNGLPLQVQGWSLKCDEKPSTSMMSDPDGEVFRWQWIDVRQGLPSNIGDNLHVPIERCTVLPVLLGIETGDTEDIQIAKAAIDVDDNPDMYPGIDNLEGGMLKSALEDSEVSPNFGDEYHEDDTNEDSQQWDMQELVEGMDWEMEHTTTLPEEARAIAEQQLDRDPNHYRLLRMQADGTDDLLAKDTTQTERDPFEGEGYNVDLGSGQSREFGHIGIDTYPYDYGTIVHDLNQGIPFEDASCSKVRMANLDDIEDPKALLSEIHRVLMPGGQFTYEGPNEVFNYPEWEQDYPGFVLINHESYEGDDVEKDKQGENTLIRQQYLRIATPDPATANDAEPRIGVAQLDELPGDALLAADAMSYYWSDATSSGKGNLMHGYPSQGALAKEKYYMVDKDQMANREDDSAVNTEAQVQVDHALNPVNPNPPPPKKLRPATIGRGSIGKALDSVHPIMKADNEKQIVYGVILEPNTIDSQGDFMLPEDIEETAHNYLVEARIIGSQHSKAINAIPVESYIAPQDFTLTGGQYGPQLVKKGSWVLAVYVEDPEEWEKVKSGEYTGFSVGGQGARTEV